MLRDSKETLGCLKESRTLRRGFECSWDLQSTGFEGVRYKGSEDRSSRSRSCFPISHVCTCFKCVSKTCFDFLVVLLSDRTLEQGDKTCALLVDCFASAQDGFADAS